MVNSPGGLDFLQLRKDNREEKSNSGKLGSLIRVSLFWILFLGLSFMGLGVGMAGWEKKKGANAMEDGRGGEGRSGRD